MGVRPYQGQAINNVQDKREAGVRRQLISLFTGGGKTVIIANLPELMPKGAQMLVLAHTEELVDQAAEKIAHWNPQRSIAVDMAARKADGREDIIVGSVQSLSVRKGVRLEKYDPARFAFVVPDEAHHATASTYGIVIDHFMQNPFTTLVGVTATPNRADGVALGSVFDEIVFQYGMLDGINDGWLSDVHGFQLKTQTDISKVGGGKNFEREAARAVNTITRNETIVRGWLEHLWPRQTVVFTQDIQHALDLTAAFTRQGVKASAVWGDDPNRRSKIEAFRKGEIDILINAQLLIEGFDMWQVEAVIPASPTKSQSKLIQMVGRGTRLQPDIQNLKEWRERGLLKDGDKQNVVVMDPIDIFGRHSLATLPSLFGLSPNLDLQGASVAAAVAAIKQAQAKNPDANFDNLEEFTQLETFIRSADIWQVKFAEEVKGFASLQWTKRADNSYRLAMPKSSEYFRVDENLLGKFTVEGVMNGKGIRVDHIDSLADAVTWVEKKIMAEQPDAVKLLGREQKWMKQAITADQRKILQKLRMPEAQIAMMDRGRAAAYITSKFNRSGVR